MAEYLNFYENIKEANLRLQHTVVTYDAQPYYVWYVGKYDDDAVLRVYMEPLGHAEGTVVSRFGSLPCDFPTSDGDRTKAMDLWMGKNPSSGLIRKTMNSPKFNKFRPFPLGMCNIEGSTYFVERSPQRHTQQGLTDAHTTAHHVSLFSNGQGPRRGSVPIMSAALGATIADSYPSFKECLDNLKDDKVSNEAVGFSRNFAVVRGPVGTLFLAYKTDMIGFLPSGDDTLVYLSKKYAHTAEVVDLCGVFKQIVIQ